MHPAATRKSNLKPGWFVVLLFLAAGALRLYHLDNPPLDFHQTRQYIGAMVARAYYFENNPAIPEWRRENARLTLEKQKLLEPQILPRLAAWGYRLAGAEQLWIPRLVSVLCWLTGGLFLWRIATGMLSRGAALAALTFYLMMPYSIMASRSFQPDSMMLMILLASLVLVLDYDEQPSWRRLLVITVVVLIGMIVRPMCSLFVFPVFLLLRARKAGFFPSLFAGQTILFAMAPVLPVAAFYLYNAAQGQFIKEHSSFTFLPQLFLKSFFWKGWVTMIGRTSGWLPALASLLAALFLARGRFQSLLLGLWVGYLAYGLIFNYHIHTHDYYSLPLIPIVALSLATAAEWALARLAPVWAIRRAALVYGSLILVLAAGAGALVAKRLLVKKIPTPVKSRLKLAGGLIGFDKKVLLFLGREDKLNREAVADWVEIGKIVKHSSKTIMLAEDYGQAMMYHGEFWGVSWPTGGLIVHKHLVGRPVLESVEDFQALAKRLDADYFVVTFLRDFEAQTNLYAHVKAQYPVVDETKNHVVFDLHVGK